VNARKELIRQPLIDRRRLARILAPQSLQLVVSCSAINDARCLQCFVNRLIATVPLRRRRYILQRRRSFLRAAFDASRK
jgi:hypothetical protein